MSLQQARHQSENETHTSQRQTAIDAEDVHVTYDDGTEAVQGVSLNVKEGEFFGFLGPNGAGKTTTIKTLVTLLYPTQGSVRINGYDTKNDPQAVRESIGYMAQETSIDFELTPRENLRVACRMYGVPSEKREERIEELLDLVDLRDVADRRAETFSGGMQKRLDTATVLVHRPPVVFLDEPTTGLDPEARLRVWNYFEEINDRGTTVFLTTQYLEEANELCDRLAILQDGELSHTGTPAALKSAVGTETVTLTLKDPSDQNRRRAMNTVRQLTALDAATIERTADGLAIEADNARSATSELFTELSAADVTITDFDVRSPTLDDVFLTLAGEEDVGENGIATETASVQEVAR
ncbi:ATP-binding cassette domain-containing protein [Natrinema longum]|uniref:ATP-binding cassette domain-containing protein n=1 Tax=Natrinema longum TaxID=370324 RepID=UPI001CCAEE0E|nr:ATP-binding cassette domain-containing protein [Natrinema longum]MBZ6497036.1 ATP-binding cassette domain-containing protein [Natrinema longum]